MSSPARLFWMKTPRLAPQQFECKHGKRTSEGDNRRKAKEMVRITRADREGRSKQ